MNGRGTRRIDLHRIWCRSRSAPQQRPLRQIRRERGGGKGPRLPYKQERKQHKQAARKPKSAGEESKTMKKKELIERIAEEVNVPTAEAQRHFAAFEEVVTEALKAGEEVQITGFGKFSVRERKAREGRNPQTGQKMKIAAQKVPAFSAGNALKEAVYSPDQNG
jgi:DNA-binding protein HU-beta